MPVGQFQKAPLRDLFTAASADCLNLLGKCLLYEPRRRISAKEVGCDDLWNARAPTHQIYFIIGSRSRILLRASKPHASFETPETAIDTVFETVG